MRTLILFIDLYVSFDRAEKDGLLLRDMAQYDAFLKSGSFDRVYYFTYDDRDHERLAELKRAGLAPENLHVLTPPRFLRSPLGNIVYSLIGPFIHRRVMARASVLKSHQVSGAWSALIAKLLYRKPLLFRLGYPLSVRFRTEGKPLKYRLARAVEKLLVRSADHVAVTSRAMQRYYAAMAPRAKITLLPNYVDLSAFTPITDYDVNKPILYVGRLEEVKNVANLIIACGRLNHALHIYGGGPLENELRQQARDCGAEVSFMGVVANSELARIHHTHTICVLCSTREGMPKSLIETMASGLICLTTPTDGGLELIEDGKTGYVIDGFDAEAIERALRRVMTLLDPEVGRRASAHMRRNNALEHAVELELAIFDRIVPSGVRRVQALTHVR